MAIISAILVPLSLSGSDTAETRLDEGATQVASGRESQGFDDLRTFTAVRLRDQVDGNRYAAECSVAMM